MSTAKKSVKRNNRFTEASRGFPATARLSCIIIIIIAIITIIRLIDGAYLGSSRLLG